MERPFLNRKMSLTTKFIAVPLFAACLRNKAIILLVLLDKTKMFSFIEKSNLNRLEFVIHNTCMASQNSPADSLAGTPKLTFSHL